MNCYLKCAIALSSSSCHESGGTSDINNLAPSLDLEALGEHLVEVGFVDRYREFAHRGFPVAAVGGTLRPRCPHLIAHSCGIRQISAQELSRTASIAELNGRRRPIRESFTAKSASG